MHPKNIMELLKNVFSTFKSERYLPFIGGEASFCLKKEDGFTVKGFMVIQLGKFTVTYNDDIQIRILAENASFCDTVSVFF